MQDPYSNNPNPNYTISNQPNIGNVPNLIAARLQAEQQQHQQRLAAAAEGASMVMQQQQSTEQQQQQQNHQQEMEDQRHGSSASSAPCGACKFLRRKCLRGCVFAPYFLSEQGTESFCAVHKVFGASNVSKLLLRIPLPEQRRQAVLTIKYEAQARLLDPIYGCVRTIIALQRQVQYLQTELEIVRAQLSTFHQQQQHQQQLVNLQQIITADPSSSTVHTNMNHNNNNNYSPMNTNHPPQSTTVPNNLLLMQDPNYMINSNYTNSSSSAIVNSNTANQPANSINTSGAVYNNMANLPPDHPSCKLLQDHEVINDNYNRSAAANTAAISANSAPAQMMINYSSISTNPANISSPLYSASCDDQQDSARNNPSAIYDNRLIYDSTHHQDYL